MGRRKKTTGMFCSRPKRPRIPCIRDYLDGPRVYGYSEMPDSTKSTDDNQPQTSAGTSMPLPPPKRPRIRSRRQQLDGTWVDGNIEMPGSTKRPKSTDDNQPQISGTSMPIPPPDYPPGPELPGTRAPQQPSRYQEAKEREQDA
ncbi:hypothetical protein Bbelb_383520 [Branchiostoma belcheri]|nr:hypothetical protein Bbelb_383520 [Branchiostoma belcheri]